MFYLFHLFIGSHKLNLLHSFRYTLTPAIMDNTNSTIFPGELFFNNFNKPWKVIRITEAIITVVNKNFSMLIVLFLLSIVRIFLFKFPIKKSATTVVEILVARARPFGPIYLAKKIFKIRFKNT